VLLEPPAPPPDPPSAPLSNPPKPPPAEVKVEMSGPEIFESFPPAEIAPPAPTVMV
jgi:hypothetical protein